MLLSGLLTLLSKVEHCLFVRRLRLLLQGEILLLLLKGDLLILGVELGPEGCNFGCLRNGQIAAVR